ncbi:MAG: hypothetical protein ACJ77D_08430 [Chloroflexota bacterium]
MTAEPARRPEDEEAPASQGAATKPAAPAPDEILPPGVDEPVPNPDGSLTPEATPAAAPDAAAGPTGAEGVTPTDTLAPDDPVAAEAGVVTTDTQTADTTAEALATIDAASDPAVAEAKAAQDAADAKAERRMARRRRLGGAVKAVLTVVIGVVLFVGGVAIGNYVFLATHPAPTGLASDPGVTAQDAPPAAKEFIAALAVNDADAIRSSLDHDPHIDLTNEMTKYGVQHVDSVDVLGTSVDGKRSATEILMHYQREDGIPFAINLVILVNDGKIEGFR